ncbi:MAG: spermine synthase [Chloroflexi bacterium RBG_19FT_COMBO_50_10]|nr:MAG: spermine synthase [Chloroflexi bacterium RBG_19FT_COMBO_50_10]
MVVLSHYQVKLVLDALRNGLGTLSMSLDLGLSTTQLSVDAHGLQLPNGELLKLRDVEEIAKSTSSCFVIDDGETRAIQFYSEATERVYSLYPTIKAPTMLVSGIPMHRIKDTDPHQDTLEKIRAIKPVVGQVLDTATGLGYTAIEAARTAEHVTTIELDPAALKVCELNPWSQELFDNPKITQLIGDSFDVVAEMEAGRFTRVIHDPPAFNLAGDLYSGEFYRELYRVMRNRSLLFHYIGDPESKSGRSITAGVIRRLEQAGFRQVRRAPRTFGVVAMK